MLQADSAAKPADAGSEQERPMLHHSLWVGLRPAVANPG